jgi:hypothetical protein
MKDTIESMVRAGKIGLKSAAPPEIIKAARRVAKEARKHPEHHRFQRRFPYVSFVKTPMRGIFNYIRTFNNDTIQYGLKRGHIVAVSPVTTSAYGIPVPSTSIG